MKVLFHLLLLTVVGTLVLAGCTGPSAHWRKPGMTQAEVARDSDDCLNEASYISTIMIRGVKRQKTEIDDNRYERCMLAKGFQHD